MFSICWKYQYHQPEIGHFIPATAGRGSAHAHGGLEPPVKTGGFGDYKGIHDGLYPDKINYIFHINYCTGTCS